MSNVPTDAAPDADGQGPHLIDATMLWSAPGGAVRRYLLAKRRWLERETAWRHTIVAPLGGARERGAIDCGGVALPGLRGLRWPLGQRALSRLIEQQAPDLIEVGDPFALGHAGLDAAQRLGVPSVAFCHTSPARLAARIGAGRGPRSWTQRALRAWLRRLYAQADLVLAPCDRIARDLRELGLARVLRQPLGLDCALFHPGRRDAAWRTAARVPQDAQVLLYHGSFAPEKRLALLADVARRLGPKYWLVAAGDGPAPPRGRQVRVLPRLVDAAARARAMASACVYVDAGEHDGSAPCALEAMACGTPVVVRGAGHATDLLDSGAGFGVRSERIDDWVEAIAAVFAASRETWSGNARARALEYDWSALLPALQQLYQRLLDGGLASAQPAAATMRARLAFGEVTQPAVAYRGTGSYAASAAQLPGATR